MKFLVGNFQVKWIYDFITRAASRTAARAYQQNKYKLTSMKKTLQCTFLLLCATASTFAGTATEASAKAFMHRSAKIAANSTLEFKQDAVQGTVKDNTGTTLIGVTVIVKGTKNGTQTDTNGKFSLMAKPGDVLVFSYLGYTSQEVVVGATKTINTLGSSTVNDVKDPSFVNSLTGKVAGLTLTHSSAPGGSTKAVLRGNKSITGNNNALYVVDGVPLPSLSSSALSDGFQLTDNGD
eukprot:gene12304-15039_t